MLSSSDQSSSLQGSLHVYVSLWSIVNFPIRFLLCVTIFSEVFFDRCITTLNITMTNNRAPININITMTTTNRATISTAVGVMAIIARLVNTSAHDLTLVRLSKFRYLWFHSLSCIQIAHIPV
uniref:ORF35 n=1 Tax=Malaco herpesvirus 4 TaxID=3031800 RepID=A0AA48P8Y6_9VIRU|nr:TPA_asm: ORF35 [Malaco herpesvirus 4]